MDAGKYSNPFTIIERHILTALVRKELNFCYDLNLRYFINYSFSFLLFTGICNCLIPFFNCLDLAEKVHEDIKETKDMVKEIHQVVKRPDSCKSAPTVTGDKIGRPYLSPRLLLR